MSAAATLPSIDGEACVHALAPHASCRACVDACPCDAWILDDDGLSLDTAACDGCGLCKPACPRDAIDLTFHPVVLRDHGGVGTAFAACEQAPKSDIAPMPCLHAIGRRDLDQFADDNIRTLNVLSGDCQTCARAKSTASLFTAAASHLAVRSSNGKPAVALERVDALGLSRRYRRAKEDSETVNSGRRRLFGALLSRPSETTAATTTTALTYVAPAFDLGKCVACDACALICPDGTLTLQRAPTPGYRVNSPACTGCGLCVDVCDSQAISLARPAKSADSLIELDPCRCAACGAVYHTVTGSTQMKGKLCRICTQTQHHKKLFQVFKET